MWAESVPRSSAVALTTSTISWGMQFPLHDTVPYPAEETYECVEHILILGTGQAPQKIGKLSKKQQCWTYALVMEANKGKENM